jgi:hypothetical protein
LSFRVVDRESGQEREVGLRSRRGRIAVVAMLGVVLGSLGRIFLDTWLVAAFFAYSLAGVAVRALMTRWFGPEWQDVPPDVSAIRHLRRLRGERRAAEAPGATAPTRDAR